MGYFDKQAPGYGFNAGSAFAPETPPAYNFDSWGRQQQPLQMAMPLASEMPMPGSPANMSNGFTGPGAGGFDGFLGESAFSPTAGAQSLFQAPTGMGGIKDFLFGNGTTESPGNFGSIAGAAGNIAKLFMGMKQYGLAKDTLAFNKETTQKQYDAQKQMTNSNLEDRQKARVASNPGAYQSPSDYMTKYGIK